MYSMRWRGKMPIRNSLKALPLLAAILVCLMIYQYPDNYTTISDTFKQRFRPNASAPHQQQQQVFLVTRGRSGSSFTAELIQYNSKVFFFYEPLQMMDDWFLLRSQKQIRDDHKNGVVGFNIWGDKKWKEALARMEEYFTCKLTNVTIMNMPAFRTRNSTMDMAKCLDKNISGWQHLQCYLTMVRDCQTKEIVFSKTIRYRIKWTEALLQKHPNFKVIFLIRDPRAVLTSQSKVWPDWFDMDKDIDNVSATYCRELDEDIRHFQRLNKVFPNRLKVVRYEDGAVNPFAYTRDLYKFLNIEYTDEIESHIKFITSRVIHNGPIMQAFMIYRQDPVATSQAWKKKALFKSISVIDKNCGKLYPLLGYRKIDSQKDLDSNRTVVLSPKW